MVGSEGTQTVTVQLHLRMCSHQLSLAARAIPVCASRWQTGCKFCCTTVRVLVGRWCQVQETCAAVCTRVCGQAV
jgi:hypothetical protein